MENVNSEIKTTLGPTAIQSRLPARYICDEERQSLAFPATRGSVRTRVSPHSLSTPAGSGPGLGKGDR